MAIQAYKFGLLNPVSGFDEDAKEILWLRNKLWNNLVEIERNHRVAYRHLMTSSDEALSALQSRIAEIDLKIETLVKEKKKARANARTKKVDSVDIDAAIRLLSEERFALRGEAKNLRTEVKEKIKPEIKLLDNQRYESVKAAYNDSDLWWGNYETVISAYDVARVKAMKENAELRFRSFDGTGKYAIRSHSSEGFTVNDMLQGKVSVAKLIPLPEGDFAHLSSRGKKHKARHYLEMTVRTYKDALGKLCHHKIVWPIILHRDLPEGAAIKFIHVQRRRLGDQFHWTASITFKTPDEPARELKEHHSKSACGIDIGYRLTKNGLTVATVADSKSQIYTLSLPDDWIAKMDHVEALQGRIQEKNNLAWEKLKKHLSELASYPEEFSGLVDRLLKVTNAVPTRGMRSLYFALKKDDEGAAMPETMLILADWIENVRRDEFEMVNLRDKLINRRKSIYRNFAAQIAANYALVRIEDMNLRQLAQTKFKDGSDNPMPQTVRNNRTRAALYDFAMFIQQAVAKNGGEFEKMPPFNSTITCSVCGHVNQSADTEDIHFCCSACDTLHNQDENAAKNFLSGRYLEGK